MVYDAAPLGNCFDIIPNLALKSEQREVQNGEKGDSRISQLGNLLLYFFFSAVCVDINQATSKFYHDLLNKAMRPEIRPLHTLQSHTIAK